MVKISTTKCIQVLAFCGAVFHVHCMYILSSLASVSIVYSPWLNWRQRPAVAVEALVSWLVHIEMIGIMRLVYDEM